MHGEPLRRGPQRAWRCHLRRRTLSSLRVVAGIDANLLVLVVIAAIITEMAGALVPLLGGMRRYDGPLGKSDRAFAFGLLAFLLGVGVAPGRWTTAYLAVLLALAG